MLFLTHLHHSAAVPNSSGYVHGIWIQNRYIFSSAQTTCMELFPCCFCPHEGLLCGRNKLYLGSHQALQFQCVSVGGICSLFIYQMR